MKILFLGDSWQGSSDRSMREALARQPDVEIEDIGTDLSAPLHQSTTLRVVNKIFRPLQIAELEKKVLNSAQDFRPDVIVAFKGWYFSAEFLRKLRRHAPLVNMFPDPSPHIYGSRLKRAMHEYDLVISRKIFHPELWKSLYGYDNRCVHVSYGYSRTLHERNEPPRKYEFDVVMIATCRSEYEMLIRETIDRLKTMNLRFAVGGRGWNGKGFESLPNVTLGGGRLGAAYVEWLRKGKIVVAPVWTQVKADGVSQPGDQMTERTLECAAAYTFFIHKRTDEARQLYDEATEVPMYDDAAELSEHIRRYIGDDAARTKMAAAAHARAVPAYSIDSRAAEIVGLLRGLVAERTTAANAIPA